MTACAAYFSQAAALRHPPRGAAQPLYVVSAAITLPGDAAPAINDSRRVGFRVVALVTDDDADPAALRAEINARIESARGPIGPLNRFQIEEMIDPRDTRRLICDWVDNAYRIVSQPAGLVPRALQFRP